MFTCLQFYRERRIHISKLQLRMKKNNPGSVAHQMVQDHQERWHGLHHKITFQNEGVQDHFKRDFFFETEKREFLRLESPSAPERTRSTRFFFFWVKLESPRCSFICRSRSGYVPAIGPTLQKQQFPAHSRIDKHAPDPSPAFHRCTINLASPRRQGPGKVKQQKANRKAQHIRSIHPPSLTSS